MKTDSYPPWYVNGAELGVKLVFNYSHLSLSKCIMTSFYSELNSVRDLA